MTPRRFAGSSGRSGAKRQRGMVMFVALAVLILMTLAGLAMLRQMGGAVSIAGNVAFKQNATAVADLGTEKAREWMMQQLGSAFTNTQAGVGYYSSWGTSVDPSTWTTEWLAAPTLNEPATGSTVQYVIHRLCAVPNLPADADPTTTGQQCSAELSKRGCSKEPDAPIPCGVTAPYYRVTTKVTGPRRTVSYIQVIGN